MNRDELQHSILTVLNNQEGKYPDFSHTARDIMSLVDTYHPQASEGPVDRPVMLSELRAAVQSVYDTIYSIATPEESFRLFGEELNCLGD